MHFFTHCSFHFLYSVTPTLSSPSPASDNSSSREDSAAQPNPVEVDNSRPTTNIQIRLADGSRLVGTFNHDHTINDIRRYINAYPFLVWNCVPKRDLGLGRIQKGSSTHFSLWREKYSSIQCTVHSMLSACEILLSCLKMGVPIAFHVVRLRRCTVCVPRRN